MVYSYSHLSASVFVEWYMPAGTGYGVSTLVVLTIFRMTCIVWPVLYDLPCMTCIPWPVLHDLHCMTRTAWPALSKSKESLMLNTTYGCNTGGRPSTRRPAEVCVCVSVCVCICAYVCACVCLYVPQYPRYTLCTSQWRGIIKRQISTEVSL